MAARLFIPICIDNMPTIEFFTPDPLFAAQKKLSCVSMLELPHPSRMIMVGRAMKPSPFLNTYSTITSPQPGCDIEQGDSTISAEHCPPPHPHHGRVNLKASWKWMSRELKAVCLYLSVLVQRDRALHLTRGYRTIITQCQISSHCSLWAHQHRIDNST